jgi:oxygen-independent coproporphyrinogen-3 oxidase
MVLVLEKAEGDGRQPVDVTCADTLYIGGGTPSLIPPDRIKWLVAAVRSRFDMSSVLEVTMEANPGDLDQSAYRAIRAAGVDRLSLGVQSMQEAVLRQMARTHSKSDAFEAVRRARDAGFDNVSVDLILGWPEETQTRWMRTLDEIEKMNPDHVSLYLLETEGRSVLAHRVRNKQWILPDEDLVADLYEETLHVLESRGWLRYEISNFARPGRESRHNLKYWEDATFWGFGMSAHSYAANRRYSNLRTFGAYCRALESGSSPRAEERSLDLRTQMGEALMTGLRMTRGVSLALLRSKYGLDPTGVFDGLREAFDAGLLMIDQERLRLTQKGVLLANEVFRAFV